MPDKKCTTTFRGSAAATAVAAGIIALVLSSKPSLKARDVLHLIAMGSEVAPLADNGDTWYKNGAGFWVSDNFGFGLMNAENMVHLANEFNVLPGLHTCSVKQSYPLWWWRLSCGIPCRKKVFELPIQFKGCMATGNTINFLEQIEVEVKIKYQEGEAYTVQILSPEGTRTFLLRTIRYYRKRKNKWSFKSYHNWGENPAGPWNLIVKFPEKGGRVYSVGLTMRGTEAKPSHYRSEKPFRTYSAFRLANLKTDED